MYVYYIAYNQRAHPVKGVLSGQLTSHHLSLLGWHRSCSAVSDLPVGFCPACSPMQVPLCGPHAASTHNIKQPSNQYCVSKL